jgi:hypothetical protein
VVVRPKYRVRLARLKAEREALAASRVTFQVFTRLARDMLEQIEEQRRLYAVMPSRSEVLRQLIFEGLTWRKLMRPKSSGPFRPARPPVEI